MQRSSSTGAHTDTCPSFPVSQKQLIFIISSSFIILVAQLVISIFICAFTQMFYSLSSEGAVSGIAYSPCHLPIIYHTIVLFFEEFEIDPTTE